MEDSKVRGQVVKYKPLSPRRMKSFFLTSSRSSFFFLSHQLSSLSSAVLSSSLSIISPISPVLSILRLSLLDLFVSQSPKNTQTLVQSHLCSFTSYNFGSFDPIYLQPTTTPKVTTSSHLLNLNLVLNRNNFYTTTTTTSQQTRWLLVFKIKTLVSLSAWLAESLEPQLPASSGTTLPNSAMFSERCQRIG
jgi:hypothetical protein